MQVTIQPPNISNNKMVTKKKTTRTAQPRTSRLASTNLVSDNDTDTANPTDAAVLPPPPARTNTELNLLVLRRYIPTTERIISIAPFAVVYLFSPESQQWEKSGTEGTLFVCQLSDPQQQQPRYNVVILNRKSLENFVAELMSEDDIEVTEQYVILQVVGGDGAPMIYGLWIFSDEGEGVHKTKDIVAGAMMECAMRANHANFSANGGVGGQDYDGTAVFGLDGAEEVEEVETTVQPASTGQNVDLLSLFNKHALLAEQNHVPTQPPVSAFQSQFSPNADTDFFRSTHTPTGAVQAQHQPAPAQNALLDLFKSARTG